MRQTGQEQHAILRQSSAFASGLLNWNLGVVPKTPSALNFGTLKMTLATTTAKLLGHLGLEISDALETEMQPI